MANAMKNIVVGRGDVAVSAWVTDGGAGSFTDVGHTQGPVALETTYEHHEVRSEQVLGALLQVPTGVTHKVKFTALESLLDNWATYLRQPAAQLTGIAPNKTLGVIDPTEVYQQIKITGRGIAGTIGGTYATRTFLLWRAQIESIEAINQQKDGPQLLAVTLNLMYDESITTSPTTKGAYFNVVDTGAA